MSTTPQPQTPEITLNPFLTPSAATEFQGYLSTLELPLPGDQLTILEPDGEDEDNEDYVSLYSLSSKYTLRAIIDYALEQGWILTAEEAYRSLDLIHIAIEKLGKCEQEVQKKKGKLRESREEIKAEKVEAERKKVELREQEERLEGVLKTIEKELEAVSEERRQLGKVKRSFQCLRCQCQLQGRARYISYTPVLKTAGRRTEENVQNRQILVPPNRELEAREAMLADKEKRLLEWEATLAQQQAAFEKAPRKAEVNGISPAMASTGIQSNDSRPSLLLRSTSDLMEKKIKWYKRLFSR